MAPSHQPARDRERFPLGRVVATRGLLEEVAEEDISNSVLRHVRGDWGDLDESDKAENEHAIREGSRILSAYRLPSKITPGEDVRIYVITEADRSSTTALRTDEY